MAQAGRYNKTGGTSQKNSSQKKLRGPKSASQDEPSLRVKKNINFQSFEADPDQKRSDYFNEPIESQGSNYDFPDRSEEPFSRDSGVTNQVYHRYDQGSSFHTQSNSQQFTGAHVGKGPKGYQRSDQRIKEDICEMLTRHPSVDAENIEVEVKNGEVTLSGTVPDRHMKYYAEEGAANSFGVVDVINNIRLKKYEEPQRQATSLSSSVEGGQLSS